MTDGTLRGAVSVTDMAVRGERTVVRLAPGLGWKIVQALADFSALFLAGLATYAIYIASGLGRQDWDPAYYTQLSLAFASVTSFSLLGFGAYRSQMGLLRIESLSRCVQAVGAGLMLTLALTFLLRMPVFSRLTLVMLGPTMVVALITMRAIVWRIQDGVRTRYSKPVLVYGAGETGRLLAQHLLEEHSLGLKPVGFIDDNPELDGQLVRVGAGVGGERIRVLGTEQDVEHAVERTEATAVFLAMPSATSDRIAQLVAFFESRSIGCFFVPSAGELMFSGLQFGQVAGMPVFARRIQVRRRAYEAAKRVVDVMVGTLLGIVAAPIVAIAAVLTRVTTKGPAFFTQQRCGLDGKPFKIYKLRTMRPESPKYAPHPQRPDDDRITPIGRWLRRLSIDELPQLWNVILGDMSLVGPRPEMPLLVDGYNDIQRQRLSVKPGVTGLWQISADRAFLIHDNIHYDLYYVENRSVSLDIAILLMTPLVLFGSNRAM